MSSGIYKIENAANGRCYIGSAVHLVNRWATHRRGLRGGEHRNRYLQRAWDKYGEEAFTFTVLEEVADPTQLVGREQAHIDERAAQGKLYNLAPKAGSTLGTKRTAATKAKISASNTGKSRTEDARATMSEAQKRSNADNPQFLAMRLSQLRTARKNIDREKHRASVRASSANRVWSDESRAKLSASKKGYRLADEAIARMAATKCKPVQCLTTGTIYKSVLDAAKNTGAHFTNISQVCLGKRKTAKGLSFKFA